MVEAVNQLRKVNWMCVQKQFGCRPAQLVHLPIIAYLIHIDCFVLGVFGTVCCSQVKRTPSLT